MAKKHIVAFRKDCAPLDEEFLSYRVPSNGSLEEIRVRFYSGQEEALQVTPFIEHRGDAIENILSPAKDGNNVQTNTYLAGDDDYFVFPVTFDVEMDDTLKVHVKNTSNTYTYSLVCDMILIFN